LFIKKTGDLHDRFGFGNGIDFYAENVHQNNYRKILKKRRIYVKKWSLVKAPKSGALTYLPTLIFRFLPLYPKFLL